MSFANYCLLFCLCSGILFSQPSANSSLQKGWAALVKDKDDESFGYFFEAYQYAKSSNNTADAAEALLHLGICSFGSSQEKGLQYATQALSEFKKLERSNPEKAKIGRSKCLQLIGTIYSRQKKYDKAIAMSREVIETLAVAHDSSGTLGLAYASLGSLYQLKGKDSADYFFRKSLQDFELNHNVAYLPNAYIKIGDLLMLQNKAPQSLEQFNSARRIADSTQNKQAQVSSLLAIAKWEKAFGNADKVGTLLTSAREIAAKLSDKAFEIKAVSALIDYWQQKAQFEKVSQLQRELLEIKDKFYSLEREQIAKSLEVQFEVAEKDRKLALISKQKEVARLANLLLVSCLVVVVVIFVIVFVFLKRLNKRGRQLLKTKEALVDALENQKIMQQAQFQNDLDHKESQLSAITLQMLQKHELVEDIKLAIEKDEQLSEQQILKMVNKYLIKNDNWTDFDQHFESLNKNFYLRLKQRYPEISANDLKICALIKLNLSIKEMASILNISPDSVKTARYRMRKKLQLATEENLTDFILSI